MKKTKKNDKICPDPYEDVIIFEKLDPYEALIRSKTFLKENKKSI